MNAFSIRRVGLLLRSEFKLQGWQALIGFATITAVVAFITLISNTDFHAEMRTSNVLFSFTPLILYIFGFMYFIRVHSIIHEMNTLPYVSIPATALEKYVQIIIEGFIYYALALGSVQLNYWVELWKLPGLREATGFLWSENILINKTTLINPVWGIDEGLAYVALFFVGIMLLTSTLISKKRLAIPTFILLPIVIYSILVYLSDLLFNVNSIDFRWGHAMGGAENFIIAALYGIGVISLIGSYFAIRNKQVKS